VIDEALRKKVHKIITQGGGRGNDPEMPFKRVSRGGANAMR